MKSNVASLRNEYLKSKLGDTEVLADPMAQFSKWFDEAVASEELEPNAMILGSVDENNQPHQRTVLLKGFDENGFVFYTNYQSNKGRQMEKNPLVNLLFPWFNLQRQIIICGTISKVSKTESEEYFHSRPRGSQLSGYVSNQSERISSREALETKLEEVTVKFEGQEVPLPEYWGGYLVKPVSFEFWQGRENRLHDRIYFECRNEKWEASRLSP